MSKAKELADARGRLADLKDKAKTMTGEALAANLGEQVIAERLVQALAVEHEASESARVKEEERELAHSKSPYARP